MYAHTIVTYTLHSTCIIILVVNHYNTVIDNDTTSQHWRTKMQGCTFQAVLFSSGSVYGTSTSTFCQHSPWQAYDSKGADAVYMYIILLFYNNTFSTDIYTHGHMILTFSILPCPLITWPFQNLLNFRRSIVWLLPHAITALPDTHVYYWREKGNWD